VQKLNVKLFIVQIIKLLFYFVWKLLKNEENVIVTSYFLFNQRELLIIIFVIIPFDSVYAISKAMLFLTAQCLNVTYRWVPQHFFLVYLISRAKPYFVEWNSWKFLAWRRLPRRHLLFFYFSRSPSFHPSLFSRAKSLAFIKNARCNEWPTFKDN